MNPGDFEIHADDVVPTDRLAGVSEATLMGIVIEYNAYDGRLTEGSPEFLELMEEGPLVDLYVRMCPVGTRATRGEFDGVVEGRVVHVDGFIIQHRKGVLAYVAANGVVVNPLGVPSSGALYHKPTQWPLYHRYKPSAPMITARVQPNAGVPAQQSKTKRGREIVDLVESGHDYDITGAAAASSGAAAWAEPVRRSDATASQAADGDKKRRTAAADTDGTQEAAVAAEKAAAAATATAATAAAAAEEAAAEAAAKEKAAADAVAIKGAPVFVGQGTPSSASSSDWIRAEQSVASRPMSAHSADAGPPVVFIPPAAKPAFPVPSTQAAKSDEVKDGIVASQQRVFDW